MDWRSSAVTSGTKVLFAGAFGAQRGAFGDAPQAALQVTAEIAILLKDSARSKTPDTTDTFAHAEAPQLARQGPASQEEHCLPDTHMHAARTVAHESAHGHQLLTALNPAVFLGQELPARNGGS
jgi:hypothetical protein